MSPSVTEHAGPGGPCLAVPTLRKNNMADPPFDLDKAHRWFAIELNNRAWDLLEAAELSDARADELVHVAHGSLYHWLQVGTSANHVRALCLLTNACAAAGRGAEAVRYARQCVELSQANAEALADWDFAFIYDGLARATAAAGDCTEAETIKQQARDYGDKISEPEDKEFFDRWFASGNWHGVG